MKALLLKTSVWLVLLFSVMGLWHVSNAAEQHTPMKAHAVTTIDKATTDKQQVPPEVVDLTQARETDEEHNSLNLAKKPRGDGFAVNLDNLKKILNGDSKLKGAIQYNVFTYEIDVTRPIKRIFWKWLLENTATIP